MILLMLEIYRAGGGTQWFASAQPAAILSTQN
jgi:hypothetical protein